MGSTAKRNGRLSDAERAELAKKLDDDLDRFVENLAEQKNRNNEKKAFDFDEWCREIDQHPAFMTELKPDKSGEFSGAVQA
ncbi:unnamed protein product, partial [Gongylonema pulchrum]|uniref:Vps4_C domain-containing protein n=1 Tax=Gongylonema pulchrum TaxID=637853 RepID=A0A183E7W0_9BILA